MLPATPLQVIHLGPWQALPLWLWERFAPALLHFPTCQGSVTLSPPRTVLGAQCAGTLMSPASLMGLLKGITATGEPA